MKRIIIIVILLNLSLNLFSQNEKKGESLQEKENLFPSKIELVMPTKVEKKSNSDIFREWLIALTGIGTLITISIGVWKSLAEYRLKIKAEKRVTESSRTEADIKLIKHFTEIMDIAHARSGYEISETAIEKLFEKGVITTNDFKNLHALNQKLEDAAILTFPVGVAAQDAAIASIAELAIRHEVLKQPALQALETMKKFKKEMAEKYIQVINPVEENNKVS